MGIKGARLLSRILQKIAFQLSQKKGAKHLKIKLQKDHVICLPLKKKVKKKKSNYLPPSSLLHHPFHILAFFSELSCVEKAMSFHEEQTLFSNTWQNRFVSSQFTALRHTAEC